MKLPRETVQLFRETARELTRISLAFAEAGDWHYAQTIAQDATDLFRFAKQASLGEYVPNTALRSAELSAIQLPRPTEFSERLEKAWAPVLTALRRAVEENRATRN